MQADLMAQGNHPSQGAGVQGCVGIVVEVQGDEVGGTHAQIAFDLGHGERQRRRKIHIVAENQAAGAGSAVDSVGQPFHLPEHCDLRHHMAIAGQGEIRIDQVRSTIRLGSSRRRRIRKTRAGTPATTAYGGTSCVTTAPAPTCAPRPMRDPLAG